MKQFVGAILLWLILTAPTLGQTVKTSIPQQSGWLGYLNQTRLSNRWGIWFEAHHRRTNFLALQNQNLLRLGVNYYIADNVRLTAGYAFISATLRPSGIARPEHRPWQQIWWTGRSGRLNVLQWVRAEQRFNHRIRGDQLTEGYGFNWRMRYNLMLQIPFKGETIQPHVPNVVVQNETFVNFGKQITYNTFDQNRFFAGLSYPFNRQLTGQLGYMNQFIQQTNGNTYTNNHSLRFFLFHNLDLRQQP